jgi:hypothetical protein
METRGTTPPVGLGPSDAPELARLFEQPGPFLTVYLATENAIENAAQRSELRWRNLRREAEEAGAPARMLDAVEPLVPDAHLEGQTLAVVANQDGVLLSQVLADPPTTDLWRLAPLPSIAPLIEWRQQAANHIVVLADRTGADIVGVVQGSQEVNDTAGDQDSDDPDLRKVRPGGWSQRRYQERAENQWNENAKQVAERVNELFDEIAARVVVVAGDVRALQLLREHLRPDVMEVVQEIDGSRAVDGGVDSLANDVVRAVATAVASDTVALLEKFREELGQGDRAVEGEYATLQALTAAQVDTLLVADDPDDTRTAYFGELPNVVAQDATTVKDLGIDNPVEGRLVDACIRAAFGTSASVRIVPGSAVRDGVGAILRFTTTPGSA